MKVENLKEGMEVIISKDISETDRLFSSNDDMLEMRGKKCTVEIVNGSIVYVSNGRSTYMFSPEDIIPYSLHVEIDSQEFTSNKEPQMFNAKNL